MYLNMQCLHRALGTLNTTFNEREDGHRVFAREREIVLIRY